MEPTKVYHFVTTFKMLNQLNKFSFQMKMSFSKTLRFIIDTMIPLLDYYVFFEEESVCFGYNMFGSEVDIKFYISTKVYRKLKNTQGVMHTFSVAVLVRKLIELFFFFQDKKGLAWLTTTMKRGMKKIINYLAKTKKHTKSQHKMRHMYGDDMMFESISMMFSKNYTLLSVELAGNRLIYMNNKYIE